MPPLLPVGTRLKLLSQLCSDLRLKLRSLIEWRGRAAQPGCPLPLPPDLSLPTNTLRRVCFFSTDSNRRHSASTIPQKACVGATQTVAYFSSNLPTLSRERVKPSCSIPGVWWFNNSFNWAAPCRSLVNWLHYRFSALTFSYPSESRPLLGVITYKYPCIRLGIVCVVGSQPQQSRIGQNRGRLVEHNLVSRCRPCCRLEFV